MIEPVHVDIGWDCHAHVFGPYDHYPLAKDRAYTPPEALLTQYIDLINRLTLSNGVLVQPSMYGSDHSLLLDVLAQAPALRGVAVFRSNAVAALKGLRNKGIRALRFSHRSGAVNFVGSASLEDLMQMTPALANEGLHAELWTDCQALPAIEKALELLPIPLVIDHMGGFDVNVGVQDPGFQCLLRLLESGKVWVKLCAYRNLLQTNDWSLGQPFHEALIQANPDRLLWGTDWPHLRVTPVPEAQQLKSLFMEWTNDPALVQKILQVNPLTIYA